MTVDNGEGILVVKYVVEGLNLPVTNGLNIEDYQYSSRDDTLLLWVNIVERRHRLGTTHQCTRTIRFPGVVGFEVVLKIEWKLWFYFGEPKY